MRGDIRNILAWLGIVMGIAVSYPVFHGGNFASAMERDRDCADFTTQTEAQAFYDEHKPGDPHDLDRDGDGTACEWLP